MDESIHCQFGGCVIPAKYQTYFLGGPFLRLCEKHEEEIFPPSLFPMADYLRRKSEIIGEFWSGAPSSTPRPLR